MGKGKSHRVKAETGEATEKAPLRTSREEDEVTVKDEGVKGIRMEQFTALEHVDVRRIISQAEQLLEAGDVDNFENFVHALESQRQHYIEVERQSTAVVRQMEQEFTALRSELAYNPAAIEQYREMQLTLDIHLSRLQAGRKEAEALTGILVKLRPELERFVGKRKAIELAMRARDLQKELRKIKEAFLPVFEQVVEKIFTLNRDAASFNSTVSVAHLPQTQFLQCRVDLTQLLAAFADLDIVVTPEMEQLAAILRSSEESEQNGTQQGNRPAFSSRSKEEQ